MILTGVRALDDLVNPLRKTWSTEFYGDRAVVEYLFHRAVAILSRQGPVKVLIARESGGLRADLLEGFCRLFDCNLASIAIGRAFRTNDVIELLGLASEEEGSSIVLLYPFSFLGSDPSAYSEATKISGLILRASAKNFVVLFNEVTKFGERMPEGGSMHHHVVKVIVRVSRLRGHVVAELIKHPAKRDGIVRRFSVKLLKGIDLLGGRNPSILEWLAPAGVAVG